MVTNIINYFEPVFTMNVRNFPPIKNHERILHNYHHFLSRLVLVLII